MTTNTLLERLSKIAQQPTQDQDLTKLPTDVSYTYIEALVAFQLFRHHPDASDITFLLEPNGEKKLALMFSGGRAMSVMELTCKVPHLPKAGVGDAFESCWKLVLRGDTVDAAPMHVQVW